MYLPFGVDNQALHPLPRDAPLLSHVSNLFDTTQGGAPPGGWSSLIGIVTAIIGNVLISFALNTQRYAHIRLARERQHREDREDEEENLKSQNYGTTQNDIAEVRGRVANKGSCSSDEHQAQETDALLSPHHSRHSSNSDDSDSTVRPTKNPDTGKSYLQSPYWWLGISLMTIGEAGNFLAYGFAPASIVSPLGVVALIVNCLIAPWMLHERFRWRDGLGVLVAVGGAVVVVLSASDSNPKLAPENIWQLITTWEFETYLGITIFLILVLMVGSNTEFGEKSILVDLGLVGLFGGYTALSTKGVASLLSNTLWRAITFPITYLLVAVLVFTAVMQIKYVNRALQRFDSTQVIPTQFVLFTISVILGSAILYRDFETETRDDAIKFVAGCALTFFGVWLITSGRKNQQSNDDDASIDTEDAIDLVDETGQQHEAHERTDGSARLHSVRSNTPSVIITSNDAASEHCTFGGPSPVAELPDQIPTNISAIHVTSAEEIPATPSKDDNSQPPRMHATTSTPVLPTASTLNLNLNRPPPSARLRSTASRDLHNRLQSPLPPSRRPSLPGHADSNTPGRRSFVDMLPGPFVTPLSSSLTVIVADSLRRGVDLRPQTIGRRRTSRRTVRPQRSFAAGDMGVGMGERPGTSAVDGSPLRMTTSEGVGAAAQRERERLRGRSFSDYFWSRRVGESEEE